MKFSADDAFSHRGRALEDKFFHERDQQLLARLRGELEQLEDQHKLAHVSGIVDQKVLLDLVKCGVTGESLLAMRMLPMVVVAWSDNLIELPEREAILAAAHEDGIQPGSASHALLESWLQTKPPAQVIEAWREYIHELVKVAPATVVAELRERTDGLCHRVARASNRYWTTSGIPAAQQKIIDQFVHSWDTAVKEAGGS